MERRLTAISVTAAVTKRSPCWPLVAGGLSVFVMVAGVALWQEQIVTAHAVELTDVEEAHQTGHDTENAEAHDAYLQGWTYYKLQTPEELAKAIPFFEEAIRLDPNYAQAHAALASVYWDAYQNDWAFDLDMPSLRAESRANEHLKEALKAPTPLAHVLQSRMFASLGFPGEAVLEAEKAVALDGNDATALAGLASALVQAERPAGGFDYIQRAIRLDPDHPPSYLITLGAAQFGMERFEDAAATFERAVKRNPNNELPLIYLASSYGHLRRIKDADNTIEAANDMRARLGMGDLTLGRKSPSSSSPFQGEIDFPRFGGRLTQERVRAGLSDIPALTWQYRVAMHRVLDAGNTWWDVEGATEIDVAAAKSLHDRGAVFIDTSHPDVRKQQQIPGAIHLTYYRLTDSAQAKFTEERLMAVADKTMEIVVYCDDCYNRAWDAAKAANWGYQKVYFFRGGAQAWKDAGYPVETGQ
jgi:Tfp pilus assembly protein PilF/rhodanese-related sulfurtransferase